MCKYAVVDLEMCKVPYRMRKDNYRWARETIQIGAVLINEEMEIVDKFDTFVLPEYGFIDTYINKLTGISSKDLVKAPTIKLALQNFLNWLPTDTKVVSWSMNDKQQIQHEMLSKNIKLEKFDIILENWIDCQKIFGEKMNSTRCYRLVEALVAADIYYEDGIHNGYIDAYNTALLFVKMNKEEELILNSYYMKALTDNNERSTFSFGYLLEGIDLSEIVVA